MTGSAIFGSHQQIFCLGTERLMVIIQSILLGIVQGLTEFIPVSSSAHLVIIPWLFSWSDPALESLSFDVALHLGTLLSLLIYFASDWVRLIQAGFRSLVERKIGSDADRRMAWFLVIGSMPGALAGVLFEDNVNKMFHTEPIQASSMIAMGIIIALLGVLLFMAEKLALHARTFKQITFRDALLVGLAQACALFPGVSRSGSTITAGLALGLEREAAARFSFMLSAPIVAGAGVKSVLNISAQIHAGAITQGELLLFPIGIVTATVSGVLCIRFLLRYLQKKSTAVFSYYRWALAALVIAAALVRG